MAGHTQKTLRLFKEFLAPYGLTFDGVSGKGHFRWKHHTVKGSFFTVSSMDHPRTMKNTEREARRFIREGGRDDRTVDRQDHPSAHH